MNNLSLKRGEMSRNPLLSQQRCLAELCSGYLWFHIQNRDHALCMDLPDGLQSGSIHGVLMASILQIVVVANVLHHLVVGHKVIVLSVLLILLWRPSCVWTKRKKDLLGVEWTSVSLIRCAQTFLAINLLTLNLWLIPVSSVTIKLPSDWLLGCIVFFSLCVCLRLYEWLKYVEFLTGDGIGKAVRMLGNECVLNMSPTNSMCSWKKKNERLIQPQHTLVHCFSALKCVTQETFVVFLGAGHWGSWLSGCGIISNWEWLLILHYYAVFSICGERTWQTATIIKVMRTVL